MVLRLQREQKKNDESVYIHTYDLKNENVFFLFRYVDERVCVCVYAWHWCCFTYENSFVLSDYRSGEKLSVNSSFYEQILHVVYVL